MTVRIELDRFDHGRRSGVVLYVPSVEELDPEVVRQVEPIVDRLLAFLEERGISQDEAIVALVEHAVDVEAYEREAARRGLLPL